MSPIAGRLFGGRCFELDDGSSKEQVRRTHWLGTAQTARGDFGTNTLRCAGVGSGTRAAAYSFADELAALVCARRSVRCACAGFLSPRAPVGRGRRARGGFAG